MTNLHPYYPDELTVTKLDGTTFIVTGKTRAADFIEWYAAGTELNTLTLDALDSVCLYLKTGGRRRELEASLNLTVRPTEPGEEEVKAEEVPQFASEIQVMGTNKYGEYVGVRQRITTSVEGRFPSRGWHVAAFTTHGQEFASYLILGDADTREEAIRLAQRHLA